MLKTLNWPENQTPADKILTWALAASKDEQNNAFIEISQKIAVEYPEIFAKFLEDFQKKSGKFPENEHNSPPVDPDVTFASTIAAYIQNNHSVPAIKEFRNWTGCGLKEAKDCIDRILDSKCEVPSVYLYWDKIKLVREYM